jgi:hypothetical protein
VEGYLPSAMQAGAELHFKGQPLVPKTVCVGRKVHLPGSTVVGCGGFVIGGDCNNVGEDTAIPVAGGHLDCVPATYNVGQVAGGQLRP